MFDCISDWTGTIGQDYDEYKRLRLRSVLNAPKESHKTLKERVEKKGMEKCKKTHTSSGCWRLPRSIASGGMELTCGNKK
jgi:hypothetical protein